MYSIVYGTVYPFNRPGWCRYWAALSAYDDAAEHCPVFVALTSYAAFVEDGLKQVSGYPWIWTSIRTLSSRMYGIIR